MGIQLNKYFKAVNKSIFLGQKTEELNIISNSGKYPYALRESYGPYEYDGGNAYYAFFEPINSNSEETKVLTKGQEYIISDWIKEDKNYFVTVVFDVSIDFRTN